jgi:hypothetical protein
MPVRNRLIVGVLWLASLAAVAATGRAQVPQPAPQPRVEVGAIPAQKVLSGDEIGFRIDGWQGSMPIGTFVVRVNGQWVEAGSARKMMPITR